MTHTVQNLLAILFALVGLALEGVSFCVAYLRLSGEAVFISVGLFSFAIALFLVFESVLRK